MTIDVLSCHKRNLHNVKNKRYNMNHNSKRIKRFSFNMISSLFYLLIVLYHPTFLNLYLYSNPKKIETVKMKQNEICPLDSILSFYYCNVGFVNLVKIEKGEWRWTEEEEEVRGRGGAALDILLSENHTLSPWELRGIKKDVVKKLYENETRKLSLFVLKQEHPGNIKGLLIGDRKVSIYTPNENQNIKIIIFRRLECLYHWC